MRVFGYEVLSARQLTQLREQLWKEQAASQFFSTIKDEAKESARHAEARAIDAATRAAAAEAMTRLQAKTIERLMESNDRMVGLVSDMRRVGFGILEPLPETSDTPRTIDQEDRAAVEADDDLAADDDA